MLKRLFWPLLALMWGLSTAYDRFWLHQDQRLPSWDQADYLNSAMDHGRALGLLPGGGWEGWQALLDHSPKIPPLASLVNGTVMAIAGDHPDQAAWSLSFWFALLLLGVALWGRQLGGAGLGLLAALFCVLAPGLAEWRVDYVLEIPLCAGCTWALWLLGRWLRPGGERWQLALPAALAIAVALLIKQSALLLLLGPAAWAVLLAWRQRVRRRQLLVGLALVLALVAPWLGHNLITVIGGTNRATLESAAREGDPNALSLAGWLWYPQRLPQLIGTIPLIGGLAAGGLALWRRIRPGSDDAWLLGVTLSGWLFTTLSPNKDLRYLAPLLPLLALLLARGWLQLLALLPKAARWPLLGGALVLSGASSIQARQQAVLGAPPFPQPLPEIVAAVQGSDPQTPRTLIVVPSRPQLNQHSISYYGRRAGGALVGRQLGSSRSDVEPALQQAELVLLATGSQGSVRRSAARFSEAIRSSGLFARSASWPRPEGGSYELWVRKPEAPRPQPFAQRFPALAKGLAQGPAGLDPVFAAVAVEHQLDGHRRYQQQVRRQALARLEADPADREALWSLALIAVLQNRPLQADHWFARLQQLEPNSPWPPAYRAVVLTAAGRLWPASAIADGADQRTPSAVLRGLADLSGVLGAQLWRLPSALQSIPAAVAAVERQLSPPESGR